MKQQVVITFEDGTTQTMPADEFVAMAMTIKGKQGRPKVSVNSYGYKDWGTDFDWDTRISMYNPNGGHACTLHTTRKGKAQ
jgi:hypothetical protein